jgi:hypothetical protein
LDDCVDGEQDREAVGRNPSASFHRFPATVRTTILVSSAGKAGVAVMSRAVVHDLLEAVVFIASCHL